MQCRRCCLGDKIYSLSCRASHFTLGRLLMKMINSSFSSTHLCTKQLARQLNINSFPPNSSDDLCLFFCIYPSSICSDELEEKELEIKLDITKKSRKINRPFSFIDQHGEYSIHCKYTYSLGNIA